ncbi:glycoside hydrolase family 18 protein [Daedalea quercina L-15889]|uniref:Glycoside hydrolase family 18 protein n=1 Tax=Daedalea quercina L-15889 TaxID=1314783 RepID=A0A165R432_9APHY|nr:glycoside hydrolase family 18 protein [Daedalea quercina L-15889]
MRIPFLTSSDSKSTRPQKAASKQKRASKPLAAAYYPDWSSDSFPPSSLDYSKFDILLFAFATPNSSNGITWDSGSTSTLQSLVSTAHSSGHGTKIVLSIGGWSGSYYFSQVMKSVNRAAFTQACIDAVNTYDLDGIDIDWEYPNESGAGNPYSSADAANLLSFFTSLRSALGSDKIISAAVTDLPWVGSDGSPLTDVSAYAKQMTYANIMNYDVFGASSTPGPNAPLGDLCGTSSLPQYNAEAAVKQWTAANFPADQLMLGLPLYGYVSDSTKTSLSDGTLQHTNGSALEAYREEVLGLAGKSYAAAQMPTDLDETDSDAELNALNGAHPHPVATQDLSNLTTPASGNLSSYYGSQIAFSDLVYQGALMETSSKTFTVMNGYTYAWDNCSDTPFLYDTSRTTVVTFDDPSSLIDKATFARNSGLAGAFTWSLDQDYNYVLQNAIRSGLGL